MADYYIKLYASGAYQICADVSENSFGALTAPWSEVQWAGDLAVFDGFDVKKALWWFRWDGANPAPINAAIDAEALASNSAQRAIRIDRTPNALRIYNHIPATAPLGDLTEPPVGLDYSRGLAGRLQREATVIVKGEIRQVKVWASATGSALDGTIAYQDLVITEDYVYTRDSYGFAIERDLTITWHDLAGAASATTKVMTKFYTAMESRAEGVRKRGYNVDAMEMTVLDGMQWQAANDAASILYGMTSSQVTDRGKALLQQYPTEQGSYIRDETSDFKDAIQNHDVVADPGSAWLDETMPGTGGTFRAYITGQLS